MENVELKAKYEDVKLNLFQHKQDNFHYSRNIFSNKKKRNKVLFFFLRGVAPVPVSRIFASQTEMQLLEHLHKNPYLSIKYTPQIKNCIQ